MPEAKRGLTISISWDIKKESVLRRETVCPPKGRRERLPRSAQREDAKLKQKETTILDTFEKIRALLAEQLDLDPAKITRESDIMNDFEADSLDIVDMVMTLPGPCLGPERQAGGGRGLPPCHRDPDAPDHQKGRR